MVDYFENTVEDNVMLRKELKLGFTRDICINFKNHLYRKPDFLYTYNYLCKENRKIFTHGSSAITLPKTIPPPPSQRFPVTIKL